jgi:fibronectin-binding autotransporter adhesin
MQSRAILYRASSVLLLFAAGVLLSVRPVAAENFDWRNINGHNWITSVKDQFGGTCWDFAACGAIEAKYMLTRDDTTYQPDVSEEQLVWETSPDLGTAYPDTVGGSTWQSMDYLTTHGVVLDSECPLQWSSTDVGFAPYWPLSTGWQSRVFKATSDSTTLAQGTSLSYIKACLKAYGPLTIHMEADNDFYPNPGSNRGGHQVVIVGFHDNVNGENASGGGYWIIKNSWGDGGYNSFCGPGYDAIAYGSEPTYEDYSWIPIWPQYNRDISGFTGQVIFTGPSATVTWTGGSGVWTLGGNTWSGTDMYGNYYSNFTWDNFEPNATFANSGQTITINGPVVGHGVTIASGATGNVFNGINGAVLTTTSSGLTMHESVTLNNCDVKVGATQSWTVDAGKSLYIGGSLHTIISNLTINGNGDITVTGNIDGGGALNAAGAAPGSVTKTGTGTLHLSGAAYYGVNITAAGLISFEQDGAAVAYSDHTIAGTCEVNKFNSGLIILNASNTYTGLTRIYGGAVQANVNAGIPNQSAVILQGGVLQSNSAVTFTDKFWWEVGDYRCVSIWDGGFAGGGGKMTVNLRNDRSTVTWTGDGDSGIAGTLRLNSATAQYEVEFQNSLNLNGAEREIYVNDNPSSSGDFATISGNLLGGNYAVGTVTYYGGIVKTGPGRLVLSGTGNDYGDNNGDAGRTIIQAGVLEAGPGILPAATTIQLDGGVFQSNGNLTRGWYDEWWGNNITWNNGGFAANGAKLTVNIDGDSRQVYWTGNGHNGIGGTMVLNSSSAQNEVEFQNPVNLLGGARVVQVVDNPDSGGDFATLSGVLSDTSGGATLTKTGLGTLYIAGTASNTYAGQTTIAGGTVVLAKTGGAIAIAGNLLMSEPGDGNSTFLQLNGDNEIASTSVMTFSTPVAYSHFDLNGHAQTLAGINSDPWAAIEGLWDNTGLNTDSTLTINNTANCTFQGVIRNSAAGSGTGRVKLIKAGSATLLLTNNDNSFSGGVTVSGGTLQIGDGNNYGVLPAAGGAVVNSGGTLYFCRYDAYSYAGAITGTGVVNIYQGANAVSMGAGYNTSLTGFNGSVNVTSGSIMLRSANGLGNGGIGIGSGANLLLWTSTTTTFANPIVLYGLGGSGSGYVKPAIYGDGGSGIYTLSGQITLSATSDIGNYGGNGMLTLSGRITGGGGLVIGMAAPTLADEYGPITISGSTSNNYTGGTTINRGTVYLAKSGSAIAIPGNVTINTSTTAATGSTFLILSASNKIASTAVMNFSGVYGSQWAYFDMQGNSQTLAGINDTSSAGVIEHAESENYITSNSTLTVNTTAADSYFNGFFRDGNYGTGSTGTLALIKGGSYKLTLVGPNVSGYTGGTTVNGGTLQFGDGTTNAMLPGNASVASGATLAFGLASGTSQTYPGVISGAGNVSLVGSGGSITLSGANSFTGTLTAQNTNGYSGLLALSNASGAAVQGKVVMNGGYWLYMGAANQFGSNSSVQWLAPCEFLLNGKSQTVAGINDSEGHGVIENRHAWFADPGASSTLTINNASDCYYNGIIWDGSSGGATTLAIVKNGAGKLTLANNTYNAGYVNNWTGGTTISGGTLQIGDGSTNPGLPGNVTNNATLAFNVANATSVAYNGVVSGTGTLSSVGAGALTLTRVNTYSGATTISSGKVISVAPGAIGTGNVNFSATGGTLTVGAAASGTTGFGGNGTGWALNGSSPAINSNVLTITPNTGGQANSVIFGQRVSTHNFTASFTYTDVTGGGADGFTFMLENDSRGTTALGGAGGAFGYGNILNSIALEGNIYSPYTVGLALRTNGAIAGAYTATGSVNLSSTTPVNVTLSYTDTTDTLTVQLTQGTNSYQTSYASCGLQANVGPFAYLGITGATGGAAAQQNISNFSYSSSGALATYANNVSVAAGSSGNNLVANVAVAATSATPTVTMGSLTMGAYSTLNVAPESGTAANLGYGLTLGAAALSGASTFTVANNGTGAGTLTLGGGVSGSSGVITKTGPGMLVLSGSAANTYGGATTVSDGVLLLNKSAGTVSIPGNVTISSPAAGQWGTVRLGTSNQIATTSVMTFAPAYAGSWGVFELHGNAQTLAGISDTTGLGIIENTQADTGIGNGTLTISNTANCSFNGTIRNSNSGSGTLALVKSGAATLTLSGTGCGSFTGGLTVSGGLLDVSAGTLPSCAYVINGGTLSIGTKSGTITGFQITAGSVSGSGTLTNNTAAYDIQRGTVNAVLAGSVGLNKTSSYAAIVNAPTYTGTTSVSAGTLSFTGSLPGGAYAVSGGMLSLGSLSKPISAFQITAGTVSNGTLTSSSAYDVQAGTVNAVLAGTTGLNKTGSGTATVNAPTYTGTTAVSNGTLNLTGALPTGSYAVSGGALNLGSLAGTTSAFQITGGTVSNGTLTSNSTYSIQAGRVDASLAGALVALTKTGSGTAILNGTDTYTGRTTLVSGVLDLGLAAQNAILSLGGADIQSGKMIFEYAGGSDPATTIKNLLTFSYDGGLWDRGQFRDTTATTTGLTLGWLDDTVAHTVTVKATYRGDFNLDGVVDSSDLNIVKTHIGATGAWGAGDVNYDGYVNVLDWNLCKANIGLPALGGSSDEMASSDSPVVAGVPEPGTLALLFVALAGSLVYIWRRR